jgi:hypothetical protein
MKNLFNGVKAEFQKENEFFTFAIVLFLLLLGLMWGFPHLIELYFWLKRFF